jgi:lipoprotein-releasing system ATP-binding protein
MSKVQSQRDLTVLSEEQLAPADVGPWTLEVGLRVHGLRKSFLSPAGIPIKVLCGVSFSVMPGEVIAITGVSGAGKSTLLHLLGGLEAADEGSVILDKLDLTRTGTTRLAKFRNDEIGFVFQFHHLLPDLTAVENVAMPLLIGRTSKPESLKRAHLVLENLGLLERADHPISHLSGGEQQRVAIARALIKEPRLVLADEPTGNLDTATADDIANLLAAYARSREAMIVIATHNERLAGLSDRALVLEGGKVNTMGPRMGNQSL